jgi:hypothetical protein
MGKYSKCKKFENIFPQQYSSVHRGGSSIEISWKKVKNVHSSSIEPNIYIAANFANLKNLRK